MVSTKTTKKKVSSSKPSSSTSSCKYKKVGETKDAPNRCVYVKTGGTDKNPKYYTATIVDGKRKYKVYNREVKRVATTGNGGVNQGGGSWLGKLGCSGSSCTRNVQQPRLKYTVTPIQPPREANIRIKLYLSSSTKCYLYLKSTNSNEYIVMGKDDLNEAYVDGGSNGYGIFFYAKLGDTIEINEQNDSFNNKYLDFKFTVTNSTTKRSYTKRFHTDSKLEYIKKNTEQVPPQNNIANIVPPTLNISNGGKWKVNIQQQQNGNAPRPVFR